MNNQPLVFERVYNSPIEKVWSAITDRDEMKQWYFNLSEFKAEVGFKFEFLGGPKDGIQYLHKCEILEVIPENRLTYSWRYDGYPGNSFVTFELFKKDDGTLLRLTHKGLETFPAENKDFASENFSKGWNSIINVGLQKYLEKSAN